jgi:hypothetical protein
MSGSSFKLYVISAAVVVFLALVVAAWMGNLTISFLPSPSTRNWIALFVAGVFILVVGLGGLVTFFFVLVSAVFWIKLRDEEFVKWQPALWVYPPVLILFLYLLLLRVNALSFSAGVPGEVVVAALLFYIGAVVYLAAVTRKMGHHIFAAGYLLMPLFIFLYFFVFLVNDFRLWRTQRKMPKLFKAKKKEAEGEDWQKIVKEEA